MPAGGRRQSVCGGRVVKGSRRCDNLPALTLLQPIWAAGEKGRGGDMGLGGRVGRWEEIGMGEKGWREGCGSEGAFKQQVCGGATGSEWWHCLLDICS